VVDIDIAEIFQSKGISTQEENEGIIRWARDFCQVKLIEDCTESGGDIGEGVCEANDTKP